ncbi:MAG: hypothetical protein HYV32_06035 [Candidatus Kerfeldbacteria bacterium]|nr:hypothetical protein [Candidatus Kerfeldbacteria bacterium]
MNDLVNAVGDRSHDGDFLAMLVSIGIPNPNVDERLTLLTEFRAIARELRQELGERQPAPGFIGAVTIWLTTEDRLAPTLGQAWSIVRDELLQRAAQMVRYAEGDLPVLPPAVQALLDAQAAQKSA